MARVAADVRRGELVDATIKVALAEGLEAATVRRIAQEAGVPLGTVHYCFGSKRALLEAVVEQVAQPDIQVELDAGRTYTVAEVIRCAFRSYWSAAGGNRDRQRLVYELVNHLVRQDDPGPRLARLIFQRAYAAVDKVLADQHDRFGELPLSRELLSRMVTAVTDGVALAWIADQDDELALEVLDGFAAVFGLALGSFAGTSDG
ncbi:TetR/AcrR family transcriptional regulator [Leekyejoonella antrihumi]|uniref:TetR family transcriptional regulator n=1 Tax=Leekyejoonella antrihumi TaxID=1660198 RepID=A0A563E471_9MICO|nr:TetR/AcrR family transcriptional regulator [Leekyejoonella antrihumi]TWP37317.1 TetR family transcriptional regulator [Leekyejoonella antrihumi]